MAELTYQKLKTLMDKVEYCLDKYKETRDSDIELYARMCENFYPPLERPLYNWRDLAYAMHQVVALESVTSLRRQIIRKHHYTKYLPTSAAIARYRQVNYETWLHFARNNPKDVEAEEAQIKASNIPAGWDEEGNYVGA